MSDRTTDPHRIDVEAQVVFQPASNGYVATVTGGRPDLAGLFAFGDTQSAVRRGLFDIIAEAASAAGAPAMAADAVIRITIPETYDRPLGAAPAAA